MLPRKNRCLLLAALVSSCGCICVPAQVEAGAAGLEARRPALQIRVFNLARVSRRDLAQAESEASRIFSNGEMELRWAEGNVHDKASFIMNFPANALPVSCAGTAAKTTEVRMVLVPRMAKGMPAGTLGFSLPCARFGIDSTIYVDQCEAVSYHPGPTFCTILGYAMAHELGHVLLRSGQHSAAGLMRQHWDKTAWMSAAAGDVWIEQEQARRMRIEVGRMDLSASTIPRR